MKQRQMRKRLKRNKRRERMKGTRSRWRMKAFLMCQQARRYRKFVRFRAMPRSLRRQKRRRPQSRGKAGIRSLCPLGPAWRAVR